jgi:PAS domain S-box-containing protein
MCTGFLKLHPKDDPAVFLEKRQMKDEDDKKSTLTELYRIIIPVCLTFILFALSVFLIFVPTLKKYMIEQKKELIREMNDSNSSLTYSLLSEYNQRAASGELSLEDAKTRAAQRIRNLRYGPADEDYFWIIDMDHKVIMHPYMPGLEGEDQAGFTDSGGKHVFAEFVRAVKTEGSGYVDHRWPGKNNPEKQISTISYVKLFEPWGWIVGTGVYIDDIDIKIKAVTHRLFKIFTGILAVVLILSCYVAWQVVKIEKKRSRAENAHRLDILHFNKLKELNQMAEASLEDLTRFSLEEAIQLTQSSLGYLVFLKEDETELALYTWSKGIFTERDIPGGEGTDPVRWTGLWRNAVRQRNAVMVNDYKDTETWQEKGHPEDHAAIFRYLILPVLDSGRIVAVAGVGNKKEDYDTSDVRQLNLLMDCMWKIIHRKRSEMALRESEERYRLLTDNVTDSIWTLQVPDLRFLYICPSIENILGYTPEQMQRLRFEDYLTEESRKRISRIFAEEMEKENDPGMDSKRSRIFQIDQVRKDGSTIWTEITVCFLRDETGKADRILGVTRDITERRRMERQLNQSQKMEAIGTLAGGIAHDFNNILSAVLGFTELAKMKCTKDTETVKYLDKIFSAGIRARDLVRHILVFSRQQDIKREPISIAPLVKECLHFIRASIPRNIDIIQNIQGADCTVMADPSQIHQVIMNLCTNAAQAMKGKSGRLEVCLKPFQIEDWERFRIKGLRQGKYLKLTVSDSGCGIPESVLERIFEPFFTTKERGEGTGMGLSIVHGIVKDMGGAVSVYSEPGRGTTFQVFFPVYTGKADGQISPNLLLKTGTGRILLVDDEENIVASEQQILTAMGYEVVGVTRSPEAVHIFKQEPDRFDLVLTDMTMPEMTGIELSKAILNIRKNIPIILCTGFSEGLTSTIAREMGDCHIVMKPVIAAELAGVIHAVLNHEAI